MAKNVMILGAGASREAGAPLMFDFLDQAENILSRELAGEFEDDFKLVFRGLYQLERVLAKASVDINNLESVFGAFEMARLCTMLGSLDVSEVRSLVPALQNVILRTIELTVKHQGSDVECLPPVGYHDLKELIENYPNLDISFISFNYDLAMDHAIWCATQSEPNYGFGNQKSASKTLLKLHGSIHWFKDDSGSLRTIPVGDLLANPYVQTSPFDSNRFNIITSRKLSNLGDRKPYIVPPTWRKGDHYDQINTVWECAARELSNAENIFVCGFSLPEIDQYFKYLFALATTSPTRIKRFVVENPEPTTEARFRSLLGPLALERLEVYPEFFTSFVQSRLTQLIAW